MTLANINFLDPHTGRPIDPGYGNEGGGGRPDNSLPSFGHPDAGLPWAPVRPGSGPIDPAKPWPPLPWPPRDFPPSATDPDWGVGAGVAPSQPIYLPPDMIDNGLPPVGENKPLPDPPPGTIWPPIAGLPEGKCALLAWFYRVGWRYVIVEGIPSTGPVTPTPK